MICGQGVAGEGEEVDRPDLSSVFAKKKEKGYHVEDGGGEGGEGGHQDYRIGIDKKVRERALFCVCVLVAFHFRPNQQLTFLILVSILQV